MSGDDFEERLHRRLGELGDTAPTAAPWPAVARRLRRRSTRRFTTRVVALAGVALLVNHLLRPTPGAGEPPRPAPPWAVARPSPVTTRIAPAPMVERDLPALLAELGLVGDVDIDKGDDGMIDFACRGAQRLPLASLEERLALVFAGYDRAHVRRRAGQLTLSVITFRTAPGHPL